MIKSNYSQSALLDSLLHNDAQLRSVVDNADKYELQVIYTQIDRDSLNQPHFTQHSVRLDARSYFNPASLVKLPVAALALEKLRRLSQPGLTRNSPMATGTAYRCQTAVPYSASSDSNNVNTVGNYIKRMLLVSDNNAYNRMYEFLGQRPLNERLWQMGYPNVRIVRRFAPCDTAANRFTNPIDFYTADGQILYQQAAAVNQKSLDFPLGTITKGNGYRAGARLIRAPYNFTTANYLPLQDVTDVLKAVLFPYAVALEQRFDLASADYAFLRRYLSSTPQESGFTAFATSKYFDAYKKYLFYGRQADARPVAGLRIYNVVGMSHGYLADAAYFADSVHQTEFMLSAVLYVNQDGIINDGAYEYDSVGLPFLAQLGKVLYEFELKRHRKVSPDFRKLFTTEAEQ